MIDLTVDAIALEGVAAYTARRSAVRTPDPGPSAGTRALVPADVRAGLAIIGPWTSIPSNCTGSRHIRACRSTGRVRRWSTTRVAVRDSNGHDARIVYADRKVGSDRSPQGGGRLRMPGGARPPGN